MIVEVDVFLARAVNARVHERTPTAAQGLPVAGADGKDEPGHQAGVEDRQDRGSVTERLGGQQGVSVKHEVAEVGKVTQGEGDSQRLAQHCQALTVLEQFHRFITQETTW